MANRRQFCTFRVDDLFLGIEVSKVQEVIRYHEMTRVPLAAREVSGLINLRGQIVTAIDLRQRIGLPPRKSGQQPMNVVINLDDGAVSFLVDDIGDVLELDEIDFEPAPETLKESIRDLVSGLYKLGGELLLVLKVEKAAEPAATPSELAELTRE